MVVRKTAAFEQQRCFDDAAIRRVACEPIVAIHKQRAAFDELVELVKHTQSTTNSYIPLDHWRLDRSMHHLSPPSVLSLALLLRICARPVRCSHMHRSGWIHAYTYEFRIIPIHLYLAYVCLCTCVCVCVCVCLLIKHLNVPRGISTSPPSEINVSRSISNRT